MQFGVYLASYLLLQSASAEDPNKTSAALVETITVPFDLADPIFETPAKLSLGLAAKRRVGVMPWVVEAGLNTPLSAVMPGCYALVGPSQPLTEVVSLSEKLSWKGTPRYGDHGATQAMGLAVGPTLHTGFGAISLPVGCNCSLVHHRVECNGSMSAVIIMALGH